MIFTTEASPTFWQTTTRSCDLMTPEALPWSSATFKTDSFVAFVDSACRHIQYESLDGIYSIELSRHIKSSKEFYKFVKLMKQYKERNKWLQELQEKPSIPKQNYWWNRTSYWKDMLTGCRGSASIGNRPLTIRDCLACPQTKNIPFRLV